MGSGDDWVDGGTRENQLVPTTAGSMVVQGTVCMAIHSAVG